MKIPILFLILLIAVPSVSLAYESWLTVTIGYGTYAMDDLNDVIREMNATAGGDYFDEIDGGALVNASGGIIYPSGVAIGLSVETLRADTKYADPDGSLDIDFPAVALTGIIEYQFPTRTAIKPHISGEFGKIFTDGRVTLIDGGGTESYNYEGSAIYLAGVAGADMPISSSFSIRAQVGYRLADMTDLKYNTYNVLLDLDYTGFFIRAGLRWGLK